jgi:hypothetical protein
MKKTKLGMKKRFPGWKGSKRSLAVEPYSTKPLLFRVKTSTGYVSFGTMKAVTKFINKMKKAEAKKAARQS